MEIIHNHANNERTIGLGEIEAVLNGVQFRTRHNDYRLKMPHRTSKQFHAAENVPFPEVPPSVSQHVGNIPAQVSSSDGIVLL